jgi:hypothetical protein
MDTYLRNSIRLMRITLSNALVLAIAGIITVTASQLCYSEGEGDFLLFEAGDIADWESSIAPGEAKLTEDGLALISGIGGWGGGVASPWLEVDFAKSPAITIKVHDVSSNWVLKLGLYHQDGQWGPYIQGDTNTIGEFSYELPGDLHSFPEGVNPPDPKGIEEVQIRIWGVGVPDAWVSVESINMFYKDAPDDRPRFVDPELEKAYAAKYSPVQPRGKLITSWALVKKEKVF